ncbi:uncharacterized protein LOC133518341 [Cydia pomonella]|uniref:uncharacterized protein LOC133518341 n=1 Tax=Cydia pomonella TaxID=82600 RepID=UPI002ADE6E55|nr:uncharacterized protein LOC133518341 [Cydia pomonella]
MSPLARSLLALAALLAAADAQGQCTTKTVGQVTNHPVYIGPVHIDPPAEEVDIDDGACGPYRKAVGEKIVCCNTSLYPNYPPPNIDGPYYPPYLSPFTVSVVDPRGCDCHITQYCPGSYKN